MKLDGLYANIHAKRERIAAGSGEKMRKAGSEGAPSAKDFKQAAKTAKPEKKLQRLARFEFDPQDQKPWQSLPLC